MNTLFRIILLIIWLLLTSGCGKHSTLLVGTWERPSDQPGEEGGLIVAAFLDESKYAVIYTKGSLGDKPEYIGTYTLTLNDGKQDYTLVLKGTSQKTHEAEPDYRLRVSFNAAVDKLVGTDLDTGTMVSYTKRK